MVSRDAAKGIVVLGTCGGALALMLCTAVWYRSWNPFMDDGPFQGSRLASLPARAPDQVVDIYGGLQLLVYDRGPQEPAPTVALREAGGRTLWSIVCTADGLADGGDVQRIRFDASKAFPFRRPRVRGVVDWSHGQEATWWFISRSGVLEEYWYSW